MRRPNRADRRRVHDLQVRELDIEGAAQAFEQPSDPEEEDELARPRLHRLAGLGPRLWPRDLDFSAAVEEGWRL